MTRVLQALCPLPDFQVNVKCGAKIRQRGASFRHCHGSHKGRAPNSGSDSPVKSYAVGLQSESIWRTAVQHQLSNDTAREANGAVTIAVTGEPQDPDNGLDSFDSSS